MEPSLFIENLIERKKQVVVGIIASIAVGALLIAYFQSGPNATTYASAQDSFIKWEATPEDETLYNQMKKGLSLAPALQQKYEAIMVQRFLDSGRLEEALKVAETPLSRVEADIPFHAAYAKNSLIIERGDFQTALENAVALKEHMGILAEQSGAGSLLYAYNLLRIACLQQELDNRPGEKAAWGDLESFLSTRPETQQMLVGCFSDQALNLNDYIQERKKG